MAGKGEDIDWSRVAPRPAGGQPRLSYREVMQDALGLLRRQQTEIGRLLLAPLLIAFAVQTVNLFTAPSQGLGQLFGGLGPIAFLVSVYLGVWLAVSVTRLALWGRVDGYLPVWRRADWRYFGYLLLFWIGFVTVAVFLSLVFGIGASGPAGGDMMGMMAGALQALALAGALCLYPFARVWLALPAAALGPGFGPGRAWSASAGNAGTLIALVLTLIGLVLFGGLFNMIVVLPLSGLLGSPVPGLAAAQAINLALGMFAALVAAAALGRCVGAPPRAPSPAA
ncbi:hypothetical protein SAMN06265365_101665 [Tistlia consotensis]|uniref:Membrane domain of glycerophosphoryl diester phosphodiesterase n=1 Tax=Tistlia consotensis USBA 355 TaxID=560819 RepID=A0A1Y6B8N6_9PROT|nr:hypothetical protein [Tistlia consotensis]SME94263.1 hypothetical protein SAMN05428998_101664 [Tistlia consotensis USBA 355]SNR29219.1 hypothetical protein SAMN06265365_101665 [Tistlia consotensis]